MCNLLTLIPSRVSALNRDFLQLQSNRLHGNGSCLCKAPWDSHEKAYIQDTVNILGKARLGRVI